MVTKVKENKKKNENKSFGEIRNGFAKGLKESISNNPNIVVLTADLTDSLKLGEIKKNYPKNFFQFGISEQNMLGAAGGMCLNNKIPFVTSYAAFNPGRNWDQLRVSICYSNHNVKILGAHAGLATGKDGATHQALEDIAITRVLPNMTVIVPCDEEEMRKAVIESTKFTGPIYLRSTREKSLNITNKDSYFKIGKINVIKEGNDLTIITCGLCVELAINSLEELKKENIDVEIINCHTIKPLDGESILKSLKKTKAILSIEEHQISGGLSSAIAEFLTQNYLVPQEIIAVNDTFGESGTKDELFEKYSLSINEIIKKSKKLLKRKKEL